MAILDEYSNFSAIYFLKTKDKAIDKIIGYISWAEILKFQKGSIKTVKIMFGN